MTLDVGLHLGITSQEYHADPVEGGSLSSSGARRIIPPDGCPARFKYDLDHPRTSDAFDFGHAAHKMVLGAGAQIVVVDHPDWRTKAAKAERDTARAAGDIPLLRREYVKVEAMAEQIRAHPIASSLLHAGGDAEPVLIWHDPISETMNRAMLDVLPNRFTGGRFIVSDYKTASDASAEAFARDVADFGYHQQEVFYCEGVRALGIHDDPKFLFVVQEKNPPYLVNVVELDHVARMIGAERNAWARSVYAECMATDRWPGYSEGIEYVALPKWVQTREGITT